MTVTLRRPLVSVCAFLDPPARALQLHLHRVQRGVLRRPRRRRAAHRHAQVNRGAGLGSDLAERLAGGHGVAARGGHPGHDRRGERADRAVDDGAADDERPAAIAAAKRRGDAEVLDVEPSHGLKRDRPHDPAPVPPVLRQAGCALDVVDAHDQQVRLTRSERRRRQTERRIGVGAGADLVPVQPHLGVATNTLERDPPGAAISDRRTGELHLVPGHRAGIRGRRDGGVVVVGQRYRRPRKGAAAPLSPVLGDPEVVRIGDRFPAVAHRYRRGRRSARR